MKLYCISLSLQMFSFLLFILFNKMFQGRRTASMKASFEAVNRGADLSKELQLRVLNPPQPILPPVLEPPVTARISTTKK